MNSLLWGTVIISELALGGSPLVLKPAVNPAMPESFGIPHLLLAQGCNVYFGRAVTGASIYLDTCTARRVSDENVRFVYYLGNERVESQANCLDNTWTTYPERATHRPRSAATQKMLDTVCSY